MLRTKVNFLFFVLKDSIKTCIQSMQYISLDTIFHSLCSYQYFLVRCLLLTGTLMKHYSDSLYGRNHDLANLYGILVTTDQFHFSQSRPSHYVSSLLPNVIFHRMFNTSIQTFPRAEQELPTISQHSIRRPFLVVRVVHPLVLYVMHDNDVRFVFTPSCL